METIIYLFILIFPSFPSNLLFIYTLVNWLWDSHQLSFLLLCKKYNAIWSQIALIIDNPIIVLITTHFY